MTHQAYVIVVWGYEQDRLDDQILAAKILAKTIKKQDSRPVWLLFASDIDSNKTFDTNIDRVINQDPGLSVSQTISNFIKDYDQDEFLFLSATSLMLFDISHVWNSFRHDQWVIPSRLKDHRNNRLFNGYYKELKTLQDENLTACYGFPCFIRATDEVKNVLQNIAAMDDVWPLLRTELYGEETRINKSWNYFTSFVYSTSDIIRKDPSLDLIYMGKRDALIDDTNWSKRSWIEFLNFYLIPGEHPVVKIENYVQLGIIEYKDLNLVTQLETWAEKS